MKEENNRIGEAKLKEAWINFVKKNKEKVLPFYFFNIEETKLEFREEGYSGEYDVLIAVKHKDGEIKDLIPCELKSEKDVIDERLQNQIAYHLLTKGKSVLVLHKNHIETIGKNIQLLPSEIWSYDGKTFEKVKESFSKYDDFRNSLRSIQTALPKQLIPYANRIKERFSILRTIVNKIEYNQMFYEKEIKFTDKEINLLKVLFANVSIQKACLELRKASNSLEKLRKIEEKKP